MVVWLNYVALDNAKIGAYEGYLPTFEFMLVLSLIYPESQCLRAFKRYFRAWPQVQGKFFEEQCKISVNLLTYG